MSMTENPKILLVDDKRVNLKTLLELLNEFDAELVTAESGNEALEKTLEHEFALILLDVQMPEMDGYETAELMRSRIDTPIIFITAFDNEQQNISRGYQSGAVDYLIKPIIPDIMKGKIRIFLNLYEQQQKALAANRKLQEEIERRKQIEVDLENARDTLEETVETRTCELKEAYSELRDRDTRVRLVINNIPVMVAFIDKDETFLFANDRYADFTGSTAGIEGRQIFEILGEATYENIKPHVMSALAGNTCRFERIVPESENTGRIITTTYVPHRVDGVIEGFFALLQDVTEERAMLEKQNAVEAQFRQLKKLKAMATITGGVAHEFNNLLVPIIGFSKMVRSNLEADTTEADYMDRVIKAAYRAKGIVSQIRVFSRKKEEKLESINLGHAVDKALETFRNSVKPNITVKTDIRTDLPPVLCNTNSVQQIIQNLCDNSVDAMPQGGGLFVSLDFADFESNPGAGSPVMPEIQLTVTDTGEGMSETVKDQVFDPFFSTREQALHSGLGLSVVLGIVEQLDGQIKVYSSTGAGTRVVILLPVAERACRSSIKAAATIGAQRMISLMMISEMSILSDNGRKQMENASFQIRHEIEGIHAMYVFNKSPFQFDLMVVDEIVQSMTGIDIIEKIRQMNPEIPVLYCSNIVDETIQGICRKLHVTDILQKPFREEELISRIQTVLLDKTA